jgi:AcrR family transcriptional regulator
MTTTNLSTPRSEDPRVERTRTAVIEAAAELMMHDGPGSITHGNVATAANVSRTTVYTHWPTREDLLRATIDSIRRHKPDLDMLTGSLRTDLATVFDPLVADLLDEQRAPMIANMMERALHDPEVIAVRDEFLTEFRTVFARIIDTAIANGELSPDVEPGPSMASIVGSLLFLRFMSSEVFDATRAEQVVDDFVRFHAPR